MEIGIAKEKIRIFTTEAQREESEGEKVRGCEGAKEKRRDLATDYTDGCG
jgi:AMMECR1 domain-containing protein